MKLRTWASACVLLLAGCATVGPIDQHKASAERAARRSVLDQITQFTIQGRASVSGPTSGSVSLRWQQAPADFDLHVAGPLGVGAMSMSGNEQEVRVRAKDRSFVTRDPERTFYENLGWVLPLSGLRYWMLSLPAPGSQFEEKLDAQGRVATLVQDGWSVSYTDYVMVRQMELPRRVVLARDDVKIRVVVDDWSQLP
jgi:outer membrane lipoprotein LolB